MIFVYAFLYTLTFDNIYSHFVNVDFLGRIIERKKEREKRLETNNVTKPWKYGYPYACYPKYCFVGNLNTHTHSRIWISAICNQLDNF
jgi:hypothetical protein